MDCKKKSKSIINKSAIPLEYNSNLSLKPGLIALIIALSILNLFSCKTTAHKQPTAFDLCMRNPDYIWLKEQNKCVPRDSLLTDKQRCIQNLDSTIWKNGECVSSDALNQDKSDCLNRGDGSTWRINPENNKAMCFSPRMIIARKEDCLRKGPNYIWDPESFQCLSPTAAACKKAGNHWTHKGKCVSTAEFECSKKADHTWKSGSCRSPAESTCLKRGYQRHWVHGQCVLKSFLELCRDPKAPAEVIQSLDVIKAAIGMETCASAHDLLSVVGSLSMDNNHLKTLMPLIQYKSIKSISLQNNNLDDLRVLSELDHIRMLYLSVNNLKNLEGIEQLSELQSLYLAENKLYDLRALGQLNKLESLYLNKNKIMDLSTLTESWSESKGLMNLKTVDLSHNCNLSDIKELYSLPNIKFLFLNRTAVNIDDIPADFRDRLKTLEVSPCY